MSQHESKSCPDCGGVMTANGGLDHHTNHGAAHGIAHGLMHGNPLMLGLGAGFAVARQLFPKKYTCQRCGYSYRV